MKSFARWAGMMVVGAVLINAAYAKDSSKKHMTKATGIRKIAYRGYTDCYRLWNKDVELIVVPESGGRVLSYKNHGYEIMYENPANDGKTLQNSDPKQYWEPDGGRLDIGPENAIDLKLKVPARPQMWRGVWEANVTGPRTLQLTSAVEPQLGLQVVRTYQLDENSPRVQVTQTMKNVSQNETGWNFWSRTLLKGGGVCIQPLNPQSRFGAKWAKYMPDHIEGTTPQDDRAELKNDLLVISAGGKGTKFATDSNADWQAYVRDDWMFVKRYHYFPTARYTDGLGFSTAVYIDYQACEVEPLSPQANLKPGESYTFTEWWWLLSYPHPKPLGFDAATAAKFALDNTQLPN